MIFGISLNASIRCQTRIYICVTVNIRYNVYLYIARPKHKNFPLTIFHPVTQKTKGINTEAIQSVSIRSKSTHTLLQHKQYNDGLGVDDSNLFEAKVLITNVLSCADYTVDIYMLNFSINIAGTKQTVVLTPSHATTCSSDRAASYKATL